MNKIYNLENLAGNDTGKIARLYEASFGKPAQADLFSWKYFENPSGEPLSMGVKDGQELVGAFTIIPEEFCVFGEKTKVYKCNDLMVHPEYRKQGLAAKLIFSISEQLKQTGSLLIYTFCAKYVTPMLLKNNWLKLNDVEYYFKHKSQLKAKFFLNNLEKLYHKGILRRIGISELLKNFKFEIQNDRIHLSKDERYFRWRLKDPRYNYFIIGYYEKDTLIGYIIYNQGIKNNVFIIDLEAPNSNAEIIKTLLNAVEFSAYKCNYRAVIALTVKKSPFQALIRKNKYIKNPFSKGPLTSTMDFAFLSGRGDSDALSVNSNWDIYPLNYDCL